jgi:hypothetical protein
MKIGRPVLPKVPMKSAEGMDAQAKSFALSELRKGHRPQDLAREFNRRALVFMDLARSASPSREHRLLMEQNIYVIAAKRLREARQVKLLREEAKRFKLSKGGRLPAEKR